MQQPGESLIQVKRTSRMPSDAVVVSTPPGRKSALPMCATPQRPRQSDAAAPFAASAGAALLWKQWCLRIFGLRFRFKGFPQALKVKSRCS